MLLLSSLSVGLRQIVHGDEICRRSFVPNRTRRARRGRRRDGTCTELMASGHHQLNCDFLFLLVAFCATPRTALNVNSNAGQTKLAETKPRKPIPLPRNRNRHCTSALFVRWHYFLERPSPVRGRTRTLASTAIRIHHDHRIQNKRMLQLECYRCLSSR